MSEKIKNLAIWAIIAVIILSVFSNFGPNQGQHSVIPYSQFISQVAQGDITEVTINKSEIKGTRHNSQRFTTFMPIPDQDLLGELLRKGVKVNAVPPEQHGVLWQIFLSCLPIFIFLGIWFVIMRQMQGGGGGKGGPLSFGRSKARMLTPNQVKVTFDDVAGVEEAKTEISEVVEFLKDPKKFQRLGGKIPCGALLVGPPGTGKTLLAKAVAGEANVPFFTISGSDFVEMFVGVGASRVRNMFEQAKKQAPCIIFIDEIDAVGRQRGAGLGGGHDEREQTLNQLLVEMDGFEGKEGIIVMAATNRPDVLDKALLRPGRFDRQVFVPLPDISGREAILNVHTKEVAIAKDVNTAVIARGTPGFSGADLANLVNEAALISARFNKRKVNMDAFEQAKDKILMGSERKSMAMTEAEKKLTAYHEAGHAIVGLKVPSHDPVYKVSIIPRGRALGVTMYLPERDRYSYSREALLSQICSLFGGRIAEELIFGKDNVTTGASNDIERATDLAKNIVTKWGLSDVLGPINYGGEDDEIFLGRAVASSSSVSGETANTIDKEVRKVIDDSYKRAEKILQDNVKILHLMADALMDYETIDADQIQILMSGKALPPPNKKPNAGSGGTSKTATTTKKATKPKTKAAQTDEKFGMDTPPEQETTSS